MEILFLIIGALGLIFVTLGVLQRNELKSDYLFVFGGVFLEAYSIYIKSWVFIILQVVFILGSVYEILKIKSEKQKKT